MKTLLAAVNSQYIHSNLAVWQLKACCTPDCGQVLVEEYNINQHPKWVFADLLQASPDVLAFSCYLWNIDYVLRLCEEVHAALPDCFLLLGGPEVSFDSAQLLQKHTYLNGILVGEGEESLPAFLRAMEENRPLDAIPGLTLRADGGRIFKGAYQIIPDLNALPSPYTKEMLDSTRHKIIYFEASRGCPFSCSYCLSQISHGVREKELERVERELLYLESQGVPLLKFVDRTFNCAPQRATRLWRFAAERLSVMRLHFEIGADLLDEEQLAVLRALPQGRVQLEAGVQSTHSPTLQEVCRKTDLRRLKNNSRAILAMGTIHYHLDLIAGLPYEDYERFQRSFNDVYALQPHQLQLGFLKMLKGSKLRREAEFYGYHYRSSPPYEIIDNRFISAKELVRLSLVEEAVERYYNSGRFLCSLPWLLNEFQHPFHFYETLAEYLYQRGYLSRSVSAGAQFTMLLEFGAVYLPPARLAMLREKLRFDYLSDGFRGCLPEGLESPSPPKGLKQAALLFCTSGEAERLGLCKLEGPRELAKKIEFAYFAHHPLGQDLSGGPVTLLFDLEHPDPVYQRYPCHPLPEKYLRNAFTSTPLSE